MESSKIIKHSKQRDAIKNFLITRKDHPTAEFIYNKIKEAYPNISLGTVYRNLSLLTQLGEIQIVESPDSVEHYDGNPAYHYHFYCTHCKHISDIDMENISFINTLAAKNFKGTIEGSNTYFYGLCQNCNK